MHARTTDYFSDIVRFLLVPFFVLDENEPSNTFICIEASNSFILFIGNATTARKIRKICERIKVSISVITVVVRIHDIWFRKPQLLHGIQPPKLYVRPLEMSI